MAKGSAMGIWRGKKGSTVFYYNSLSNNGQKQAMRERNYEPKNPQSNGQADQRQKLLPAQRVASVLRPILKRSWQGVEYGQKSVNQFLKYALKMTGGYPYVSKDDTRAIPGAYMISRGTLPTIGAVIDDVDMTNLKIKVGENPTTDTVAGISTAILANDARFQAGDQLTFVVCMTNARDTSQIESGDFFWRYGSFVIDRNSTERPEIVTGLDGMCLFDFIESEGTYYLAISPDDSTLSFSAIACIVSRQGEPTPLRSTEYLATSGMITDGWETPGKKSEARKSYQDKSGKRAAYNWEVERILDENVSYDSEYTIVGMTGQYANFNTKKCRVRRYVEDDTLAAVYTMMYQSEVESCVEVDRNAVITAAIPGTTPAEIISLPVSVVPQLANLVKIALQ